jgi:hypothetical protein
MVSFTLSKGIFLWDKYTFSLGLFLYCRKQPERATGTCSKS